MIAKDPQDPACTTHLWVAALVPRDRREEAHTAVGQVPRKRFPHPHPHSQPPTKRGMILQIAFSIQVEFRRVGPRLAKGSRAGGGGPYSQ